MRRSEERELISLVKQNNQMLKYIVNYINHHRQTDDPEAFGINVLANLISNGLRFGR